MLLRVRSHALTSNSESRLANVSSLIAKLYYNNNNTFFPLCADSVEPHRKRWRDQMHLNKWVFLYDNIAS